MGEALLVAAIGDWLQFLIPLVFFIIYAINQLLSGNKKQPPLPRIPRRNPEPERPRRSEASPPPTSPPAGSGQSQLNAEIEQFLKRAEQRRSQSARREPPAKRPPEIPERRPAPAEPARNLEPAPQRELSSVALSVEQHMGQRGFRQRVEHLADDITRADEQMEEHLKQAFGHRVGTLGDANPGSMTPATDVAATTEVETSAVAMALAKALSNPQSIRQAVVLQEILVRPEHRW